MHSHSLHVNQLTRSMYREIACYVRVGRSQLDICSSRHRVFKGEVTAEVLAVSLDDQVRSIFALREIDNDVL